MAQDTAQDLASATTTGLGGRAARGGAVTVGAQAARLLINLASLAVLARLLSPAAFGYVAMVTAILGFAEMIREFGLSKAAVQARTLSTGERDNLFWLNTGLGAVLCAVVVVAAPAVAGLYGEPELTGIVRVVAVMFLVNGLSAQFRAGLQRDLRFTALSLFEVAGPLLGLAVAVAVALLGGDYWALVAQHLTAGVVLAVGPILVAGWRPGLPRRSVSIRPLVGYGGNLFGAEALMYASRNVDTIVIGMRFGPAAAGLYSRAYQLMALPINQLNAPAARVALPVLARLQDDPGRYGRYLLRGQTFLLNATVPVLALTGAVADPLVRIALGDGWGQVTPLFSILLVGGVFQANGFVQNWVFMSSGETRRQLLLNLMTRPVVILAVVLGSQWGVRGIAVGYAVAMAVQWPFALWWAVRAVPHIPARRLFVNAIRSLSVYFCAAILTRVVLNAAALGPDWAELGLGVGVMLGILGLLAALWPAYRRDLGACLLVVRNLRDRSGRGAPPVNPV